MISEAYNDQVAMTLQKFQVSPELYEQLKAGEKFSSQLDAGLIS